MQREFSKGRRHTSATASLQAGTGAQVRKGRSPKAPAVQGGNAQEGMPQTGPRNAPN